MLTHEQAESIKKQLISQIESSFPADKKDFAVEKINSMDNDELEDFLVKNGLAQANSKSQQCVFCSIISGDIHSVKIAENDEAIAVLEINPISRGHTMIIPKEHEAFEKTPKGISSLEKTISKLLKQKLKPKKVLISKSKLFGHETISLIPQYTNETTDSKRTPTTPEDLRELKTLLEEKSPEKKVRKEALKAKPMTPVEEKFWLPKRIP